MMKIVEELNRLLKYYDEFQIQSFDSSRLVLIGCWDLTYHHNIEVEFVEVSYMQCATYFCAQAFRLAKPHERELLQASVEEVDTIFCFEADDSKYLIAAQSVMVREGLVLHYKAE